ncbi:hypothetical protein RJT34_12914 [Clitoria ternatea]|uniref:Late embryogenesis abundant protein LEA-2 subgroup domain-containing protein n=1 Tax=Clitoria ternatea TaxID=43366 RepID=A0AAN9JMP2_CLITE
MIQLTIFIQAHLSLITLVFLFQYHLALCIASPYHVMAGWSKLKAIKLVLVRNLSTGSRGKPDRLFEMPSYRRSDRGDLDSSPDHLEKGHRYRCCVWSCLVMFIIIVAILLIGISYLAFLKGGMPKVNVRSFNIMLNVNNETQKMDSVIHLGLMVSNNNEKLKLLYGPLKVEVSSEDVALGKTTVEGFSQMPKNVTTLQMTMTLENADVNKYAASDLKSDINAHEMEFDVYASSHIGFQVGSLQMDNVPFLIACHQIKKMDVDFGRRPECNVKMLAVR